MNCPTLMFGGRTSVFELMTEAHRALEQDECDFCILGGVDSYLYKHRLEALDDIGFLRSKRNRDGFIPGEAASFIIIEKESSTLQRGAKPLAAIHHLGFDNEPNTVIARSKSSGVGLTNAIRQVAVNLPLPFKNIYSDLNGESYAAFEWGLAQVRAAKHLSSPSLLHHPAENYGDIGAATGAMLLTLAANDLQAKEFKRPENHPSLLFTSALGGTRAAVALLPMSFA